MRPAQRHRDLQVLFGNEALTIILPLIGVGASRDRYIVDRILTAIVNDVCLTDQLCVGFIGKMRLIKRLLKEHSIIRSCANQAVVVLVLLRKIRNGLDSAMNEAFRQLT